MKQKFMKRLFRLARPAVRHFITSGSAVAVCLSHQGFRSVLNYLAGAASLTKRWTHWSTSFLAPVEYPVSSHNQMSYCAKFSLIPATC